MATHALRRLWRFLTTKYEPSILAPFKTVDMDMMENAKLQMEQAHDLLRRLGLESLIGDKTKAVPYEYQFLLLIPILIAQQDRIERLEWPDKLNSNGERG